MGARRPGAPGSAARGPEGAAAAGLGLGGAAQPELLSRSPCTRRRRPRGWKAAAEGTAAGRQGPAERGETPGPPCRGWCGGEGTSNPPRRSRARLLGRKRCCRKRGCPTLRRSEEERRLDRHGRRLEEYSHSAKAQKQMLTQCSALICLGPAPEREDGEKAPSGP